MVAEGRVAARRAGDGPEGLISGAHRWGHRARDVSRAVVGAAANGEG